MTNHINKLNTKNQMIISIDAENLLENSTSIYDKKKKPLQKVGIEGTYLNLMKAMYDKSTATIILSGEKQNIPSKIRNSGRMSTFTDIPQQRFGGPSHGNLERKRNKRILN